MKLRPYQEEAVNKTLEWLADGKERPLVVLPTGTGKSLVQASLIKRIIEEYPYVRVICATHSKELVKQNYDEIKAVWPDCPVGIYSAGLNRKDKNAQVLFCGIQSVYNKAPIIGHADIIIADECHSISRKSDTMWGKFFSDYKEINKNIQIIGLSATPYRLDTGNLVPHTFYGVAYDYPVIDAIEEGYLCEIISAKLATHLRTSGVHKRGGEYISGELERAVDQDHLTRACCQEIVSLGDDRKSWLVFAAGNNHARHITDTLISMGIDTKCVTQETPRAERDQIVLDHKSGKLKCLVNNMIFTTGYNNPQLDLIACLRPTQSQGLWVQMVGRGMRLFPEKQNCLLLDFGRNLDRHGPIDKIKGVTRDESSGNGEAPSKQCPKCYERLYAASTICPNCEYEFPPNEIDITVKASAAAVFSTQLEPEDYNVFSVQYKHHKGRDGKPDSMMVIYNTFSGQIREWVFFDHPVGTRPRTSATKWAADRGNTASSVQEALSIDWPKPSSVSALKDGKYWKIKKVVFDYNPQKSVKNKNN